MSVLALNTAASGINSISNQINVVTDNISNAKSVAFQKMILHTTNLMYVSQAKAGIAENTENVGKPVGIDIGLGSKVAGSYRDVSMGALMETNDPLNIAITGAGYFSIALPNGRVGYTRVGLFSRDPENGNIITHDGYNLAENIVIPTNIPLNNINISSSGVISYTNPDNLAEEIEVGRLEIVNFVNEQGLQPMGGGLFSETEASGEAMVIEDTNNHFKQKWLEYSNVEPFRELMHLIDLRHIYECILKTIRIYDEISKESSSIIK